MAKTVNLLKVYRRELITTLNKNDVYPKLRKQAKQWLIDNGYNPNIN